LHDPDVQRLIAALAPGAQPTDLGGVMSLNVRLDPARLVLRVHPAFVTPARLAALQEVRRRLARQGLIVARPVAWRNQAMWRCGPHWAKLEEYIPHAQPAPVPEAFLELFAALGTLHRALAALDVAVPRPLVAIYAPPGTLRHWLPTTAAAVRGDAQAAAIAQLLRALVGRLRTQWVPARALPGQLIHGDAHLRNVGRTPEGRPVYLDFGFLAQRPRIHDLGYALAWMIVALDGHQAPERFAWERVPRLIQAYEAAAEVTLTDGERRALAPYTAAARLYHAASAGFGGDPAGQLRAELPFLRLSAWLLAHPEVVGARKCQGGTTGPGADRQWAMAAWRGAP
jgi:Ser/Thr protein kinase RdoA (MazF antagonist)